MMAIVRVHIDDQVIVVLDCVAHSGHNGRTQAQFPGTMQATQLGEFTPMLLAPIARAVRRIVVDDQDVRGRHGGQNVGHQVRQIAHFVIGGNDHQNPVRIILPHIGRCWGAIL